MEINEYLNEVWKPIRGYIGLYECSNFGRVRSVDRLVGYRGNKLRIRKGIIKIIDNSSCYPRVELSKDGVKKKIHCT